MARTASLWAISTAALLLGAAFDVAHVQAPAEAENPIAGAIDFHVHPGPDVSARNLSDLEVAQLAARHGMRGSVLKNHITGTADRAALVNDFVPEVEVFGGVVLNRPVGGLNPDVVDAMRRMSGGRGKVVWLPTSDFAHHRQAFQLPGEGIVVTTNGQVTPETEAVLQVAADNGRVLQTGNPTHPEGFALLVNGLRDAGISHEDLDKMMKENPARPLGLE